MDDAASSTVNVGPAAAVFYVAVAYVITNTIAAADFSCMLLCAAGVLYIMLYCCCSRLL